MIVRSRYTHLFSENDKMYVYNAQTGFLSEISRDLFCAIGNGKFECIPGEVLAVLREKKVVVDSQDNDTYFHERRVRYLSGAYGVDFFDLTIAPTTHCNFACPYCFEPKVNARSITSDVEDRIISFLSGDALPEKVHLTWYGGEPLLVLPNIEKLYDRIVAETGKKITRHSMITNGYLLGQRTFEFMRRSHMNDIQITLDGEEKTHNRTRSLRQNGLPTFTKITENIDSLVSAVPEVRIILRVNIDKNNFKEFSKIYRHYNSSKIYDNVRVYPGVIRRESEDRRSVCETSFSSSELLDLYEALYAEGVNVNFYPSISEKGCMIQRKYAFIIGPQGEMYKCWNDVNDPEKVVGCLMDDNKGNRSLLMKYMNELEPFDESCKNCNVFPVCNGGCSQLRYKNKFEEGCFEFCSPFKDPIKLNRALALHMQCNKSSAGGLQIN